MCGTDEILSGLNIEMDPLLCGVLQLSGQTSHGGVMKHRSATKMLSSSLAALGLLTWNAGIAQAAAPGSLRCSKVVSAAEGPAKSLDEQLQIKVETALQSDPYFYGAHVTVSVEDGTVALHGFVFSDWDLRDAIRIANKASDGCRVVNNLTIEVGGRR